MRKVNIETLSVDSSAIQSMRYFRKERSLVVKFQNDDNYLYQNVPVRLFQKMRNSYSIGKFFNKYIKNNFQLGQLFILVMSGIMSGGLITKRSHKKAMPE